MRGRSTSWDTTPGVLQFGAPLVAVAEGRRFAVIPVARVGGSDGVVSVNYATSDGTAVAGLDYVRQAGTVTLQPGQVGGMIVVPIVSDASAEPTEVFRVSLARPASLHGRHPLG